MIKYVTTNTGQEIVAFLVADGKDGYLVNYEIVNDSFGHMCPCCMLSHHHKAIMDAVKEAFINGSVQGRVRWCSHTTDDEPLLYGDQLRDEYPLLDQKFFCAGSAFAMSPEAKAELREAAPGLIAQTKQRR